MERDEVNCQLEKAKEREIKIEISWVVVVAQLLEWLLSKPEIPDSNSVIGNIIFHQLY